MSLLTSASTYARLAHVIPEARGEIGVEAQIHLTALPAGATVIPISLRFGSSANDALRFETGLRQGPYGLEMFGTSYTYPEGGSPQVLSLIHI